MIWNLKYLPEAEKDLKDLDDRQRILVLKAIKKSCKIHCQLMSMVMESLLVTTTEPVFQAFLKSN